MLLPGTPVEEAQQTLTRLQRTLSASLFMHDGREVFVTFSAGVTTCRPGETLDAALERADEALYEAKRTGKNRTCIADAAVGRLTQHARRPLPHHAQRRHRSSPRAR